MITFRLPWPPSVNAYWRHPTKGPLAGRHLISREGREYRELVRAELHGMKPMTGLVRVSVDLYPPDARRRDIDNSMKALLDALGYAGVYADDSQITTLHIERRDKGGYCVVTLEAA